MIAGHFATALVAKRIAPRGHLAFYLVVCQLQDLLWHTLHFAGVEPTSPANPMHASLDSMHAEMTYSHDLLPMPIWVVLAVLAGRALFGEWRTAWVAGGLVLVHTLCDALSGYPHHFFGPESAGVGLGLYISAPYVALAIEALFTAAVIGWVLRTDAKAGVQHSRTTLTVWALVFGGGILSLIPTAQLSLVELTGLPAYEGLSGMLVPGLLMTYAIMFAALIWADRQAPPLPA